VKQLTWKLILPLTVISFATCNKWWYVFPVDAPDTMLTGFPFRYVGPDWHTSMSLQIFIMEFAIDILVYFTFWFMIRRTKGPKAQFAFVNGHFLDYCNDIRRLYRQTLFRVHLKTPKTMIM